MSTQIEATFDISGWKETPFDDGVGVAKLTEAFVTEQYSGGIDGVSTTKWLTAYAPRQVGDITSVSSEFRGRSGGSAAAWCHFTMETSGAGWPPRPCASCRERIN